MKKTFNAVDFYTIIHTIQGNSSTALLPEDEIRGKSYVNKFYFEKGKAIYQLNPNKYENLIDNLSEYKQTLSKILKELYIEDFNVSRLDIAINTKTEFDNIYKIDNYLKELYAAHIGEDNNYFITGANFHKRNLKVSSRDYEFVIYNKKLESKGKDPANTRIEFRFKRLGVKKNVNTAVNDIIKIFDELPKHIEELNKIKVEQLYAKYLEEISPDYEGRITSLQIFVTKYADHIFNTDILKGLYSKLYSGECKNWLYRYRASGKTLTLYSKEDITSYIKLVKKSIKNYAKSTPKQSLSGNKNRDEKVA